MGFLQRRLVGREWLGILFVITGLAIVGLADFLTNSTSQAYSRNNVITGDLLIIMAQIITAVQMVYEERFVAGMDIPSLQGTIFCILYNKFSVQIQLIKNQNYFFYLILFFSCWIRGSFWFYNTRSLIIPNVLH